MSWGRELALTLLCAVLAAMGIAIAPSNPALGLFTAAMFGGGAVVLGSVAWSRRRAVHHLAARGETVGFSPGARLEARAWRPLIAGFAFLGVGVGFPLAIPDQGAVALFVGGLSAVFGAGAIVAVALGRYRAAIEVRPDGLWLEDVRCAYLVPWDGLRVGLGERGSVPLVLLAPGRLDDVLRSVVPASAAESLARRMGTSTSFVGAPLVVEPGSFGLEAGHAIKAFTRYASDPAAREELRPPSQRPGSGRAPELPVR